MFFICSQQCGMPGVLAWKMFSFWHQVCLLTSMFLYRNREPWQLRQRGSTYSRDRWLSRGEEQINTDRSVFTCIHTQYDCIHTHTAIQTHTAVKSKKQWHLSIWTFYWNSLCVDLSYNFFKCVTREKGESSSHRVKKIFRASNWLAMELMGKQRTELIDPS